MRKLTRKSLDELAQRMPVLSEEVQSSFIGGGDGSENNPFTLSEYKDLSRQYRFNSGWVDWDSCSNPELMTKDYYSYMGINRFEDLAWSGGMSGGMSGNINPPFLESDFCYKRSCVFNCLDYLDGDSHSWRYYSQRYQHDGGEVLDNGGVYDIEKIARYGGFNIDEYKYRSQAKDALNQMDENGKINGASLVLTYHDNEKGIDHAVIVEGYIEVNGMREFWYYDPTNKEWGAKSVSEITHLYKTTR